MTPYRWTAQKGMMAQSEIKSHEGLDELLPFERLLTEISTLFINLPGYQIGNEIASAQKRICELLDIDRSALLQASQDDLGMLLFTHILSTAGSHSTEAIYVPDVGEHDGSLRGVYVMAIDVTERNLAQQEAQRLHDELLHAGRISTLGELAGVLAHEINQPLSAIMSNTQAIKRYLSAPTPDLEEVKEILNDIIKEDARASEVINRMRAFLKKSKMEFEPLDLNSVLRDIVMLVKGDAMHRNIKVDLGLDPLLPLVRGDRIQLQQVTLNLVLNAFESLSEQPLRKRCVQIRTGLKNSQVLAAVEDNGIGLSVEDAEKAFQPFYTTKTEGLGMGLPFCRSIILRHQGHIWAENNPGEGTTFYFTLPAA